MDDLYESQKQSAGGFAALLWLAIGAYIFAVHDQASFFTWQAAIYFVAGMFIAALVLGAAAYLAQRGLTKVLMRVVSVPPSQPVALSIQGIGVALMVGEGVLVYFVANWLIGSVLF